MTNVATAAQKLYMARVAAEGCAVCRRMGHPDVPCLIHHVREGRLGKRNHDNVLGLCWEHHVGKTGVHSLSREDFEQRYGISEQDLAEQTRLSLY